MQNREILSLSLGELSVIFTPYSSLESVYIQSFKEPLHHVITVRQEKSGKAATDEVLDSPAREILDVLSPEKTEYSSFTSDEGYIYQGPPPLYDTSPIQPLAVKLDCAMEDHGITDNEEKTTSFLFGRTSQSENSLDQGYITSEYAAMQEPVMDDFVLDSV